MSRPLVSIFDVILPVYYYMPNPSDILLTSIDYFSWRAHMDNGLWSKGIYWITLGQETTLSNASNISKWDDKNVEAHGLIRMFISNHKLIHLEGINKPNAAWTKLETIFGQHNESQSYYLESHMISLNPSDFPYIKYYLS